MNFIQEPIEAYARVHSSAEDPLLAELTRVTLERTKYSQMQTGHVEGSLLRLLVQICGARHILEIGTFTGYSALAMAMGLPEGGEIVTLDRDPEATVIARAFWERSPHGSKIRLVLGDALKSLDLLSGPFDMAFIDADKENYLSYWEAVLPKMRHGGLIVVDNVLWSGKVLAPKEATDKAIVAFNDRLRRDARVDCVMLTVRDGVTLARVL